jgi:NADH-quinone oxidoreductase subunit M
MTLVWLIAIPFIGGAAAWLAQRIDSRAPRVVAAATMALALALSVRLWATGDYSFAGVAGDAAGASFAGVAGDPAGASLTGLSGEAGRAPEWRLELRADWIPAIGATFHLGLDGLSLVLIVLTNLLGLFAVICGWRKADHDPGLFHLGLLANVGGVVGVFLALDLLLFFFFWEMMLIPMYFLIAHWGYDVPGGRDRVSSALKFFIYTQASGLLMLVSIVALVYVHFDATGIVTFDYQALLVTPMSEALEWWLMLGFFVAFAVKMPIVPLHSWLPDAHSNAPTSGAVDLAGILLKTAAYGMLRFAIPLFPDASLEFSTVAIWLGVLGVVYGGVVAFAQHDIKRLVAYTGVSHMGFVVIGIYAGTEQALAGVIVQLVAHGLTAGALFILCGQLHERLGTRDLRAMGGVWTRLPKLSPVLLFFALAALGLPGLGTFVGEFLILSGAFGVAPWATVVAASGLVIAVVYALVLVHRTLYGPVAGAVQTTSRLDDLSFRELATMGALIVLVLALGLYPQPVIDLSRAPLEGVAAAYPGADR